jgi:NAD(P)-dependent dehydrogenase (short-subunit alcohol dehydrogenase family)
MPDKTLIVTGAARGIGRGITMCALEQGFRIVALDWDNAALDALSKESTNVVCQRCDVSREADVRAVFADVERRFPSIDGLVNNAAIADPRFPPLETASFEAWREVLSVNLDGVFLCTKYSVGALRASRGSIVNIASTRALQSEAHTEAYAASKGGVVALTHALAMSLGPEVRVNVVSPGWIDTSSNDPTRVPVVRNERDHAQHPVGRIGVPADVAELVLFLLSEKAGFITGQNFVVDGGMTKRMIYAD